MKFRVVERGNSYIVQGEKTGFRFDNKFDANRLCEYLNGMDRLLSTNIDKNVQYYTTLSKIKMIVEQIHKGTGEVHILELAIKIKQLLEEVI